MLANSQCRRAVLTEGLGSSMCGRTLPACEHRPSATAFLASRAGPRPPLLPFPPAGQPAQEYILKRYHLQRLMARIQKPLDKWRVSLTSFRVGGWGPRVCRAAWPALRL